MVGLHLLYYIYLSIYLLILYYLRKYIEVHGRPSSAVLYLFIYLSVNIVLFKKVYWGRPSFAVFYLSIYFSIYLLIVYFLRKYIEVHGRLSSAVLSVYLSINHVLFKEVYWGTWSAFFCCILSIWLSINVLFKEVYRSAWSAFICCIISIYLFIY